MKSPAASPAIELEVFPSCLVRTHSGPTPSMNSALRESVHGFLNSRSVSHSVVRPPKKGDTPTSNSSQFSIGVVSAARFGAKEAAPPVTVQLVAAPISRIAAGSFSWAALCVLSGDELDAVCPSTGKLGIRSAHATARV